MNNYHHLSSDVNGSGHTAGTNFYHRDNVVNANATTGGPYTHIRNRSAGGGGGNGGGVNGSGLIKNNGVNNNYRFRSTPGIGQFMYG